MTVTELDDPAVVASVERHDGTNAQAEVTSADTLAFRVTFSEDVVNVDAADFAVTGGAGAVTGVTAVAASGAAYIVELGGAGLAGHDGVVGVGLAPGQGHRRRAGQRARRGCAGRRQRDLYRRQYGAGGGAGARRR